MKNSKCQNFKDYIEDYLEGRLSAQEAAEIEEHLKSCPNCQKEMIVWQELFQNLAILSQADVRLSSDFTTQVMQK